MYTLLHRSFIIVPDFSKFHFEVDTLKKTLHKNAYPTKFVDKCVAKFVNNIFIQKPVFTTVPKLELRIVLPYLGNISSITKKRLNRCISKRCISKRWNFVSLKSFFKQVTDSRIILDLKIVFLKPYNVTLFINLSAEAAQLSIGFQNTRVCLLEQVNESKLSYLRHWGTTCWIVTI